MIEGPSKLTCGSLGGCIVLNSKAVLTAIALFSFALPIEGQTFRGGITGTVVDPSGAAIADAALKLVSTGTGLSRTGQSSSSGDFSFPDLPLGKYSLSVSAQGFQSLEVKDIGVEAGKTFNLQPKLSVSTQATAVEVSANAVSIETTSSALTSVIPTKTILDVPLNGRDFTQLLKLNPGVNAAGSVNGTRTNSVNWQIDGADNNDQWHNSAAVNQGGVSGVAGTVLPIDAIDEFSMQTNSDAENGRNGGGVLNLVIKSGTNAFHGSLYYFNRNEFLAARNWFVSPSAGTQKLRNSQPGGSLGGPIWRNHTFFFVTYEQQNYIAGNTAQGTTPSNAWVSEGEQVLARHGVAVNPVSLRLINTLWPANSLTGSATQNNFFSTANNVSDSYNGIVKLDHIFNERHTIAFRYFGGTGSQTEYVGSVLPYYYQTAPSRMHNFSLVYNAVISPRFVSQTLAGVNYFKQVFGDANAGFNIPALGLNTGVTNPSLYGAPAITISGFDKVGLTPPLGRIDTTGHLDETLTYTSGTHQFRFGAEYRRGRFDVFYQRNARGRFNFNGSQGPSGDWGTGNPSLNSLSDFLAGRVGANQATIAYGDLQRNYYLNSVTGFFQDSWKVKPNLTINYGLNWMFQSPLSDPTNRISTFIPADGGITYVGQGINTLWPRDFHDFGPRFGFAYQPLASGKLVVRGGYGIFYQVPNVNYFGDNNPGNGGATGILANPGGISPVYTLSNQSPITYQDGVPVFGNSSFPTGPFGAFSVSQHFTTGYVQNSNLNIQYQLNRASVIEVGYTGSLSRRLPVTLDINQIPVGAGETDAARPFASQFPNLAAINEVQSVGNGYYNGMIVSLRTSNYHGFNLKVNYTYGHSRDDLSSTRNVIPQNSYCLRCDYGNSDFDIRHTFVTYLGYSLPTPSRLKLLLGGWQLNSLLTLNGGTPFTVYSGSDTSLTGENNDRAEVVGDPFKNVPAGSKGNTTYWFNPAAFAKPALGTYSNQSRNSFYGPPTYQVDFSVFKNTRLTERINTQLRLEIFNILNTRDLSPPTNSVSSSGLGQVTSTLDVYNGAPGIGTGAPRNVQLALKILF
ncbi:MAG: TonB-dependent receptor plug [Bryobacterales bacterium]|nr:TonB-dependent receptor plug [Bryobacterales bacterium]